MTTLIDEDLRVTLNGLLLASYATDDGLQVWISDLRGWWGTVGSSAEVQQRSGADGGWSGPGFRTPRRIEMDLEFEGRDFDHLTPVLDELAATLPVRPGALEVGKGGTTEQAVVQLDGKFEPDRWAHTAAGTLALVARDPNRYSTVLHEASTGLPQTVGGLTVPFTVPFTIDAVTSSGVILAPNAGGAGTWPTFTLTGPVPAGARVTLRETGASLYVPEAVPSGRVLVIETNPARRGALLDGTARRTVTGSFFAFAPGENSVSFTAPSYDAAARLTAAWRDANN